MSQLTGLSLFFVPLLYYTIINILRYYYRQWRVQHKKNCVDSFCSVVCTEAYGVLNAKKLASFFSLKKILILKINFKCGAPLRGVQFGAQGTSPIPPFAPS
jgi:hypothetical protein